MSQERTPNPGKDTPDNKEQPTDKRGQDGGERNGNEGRDGKQGGQTPAKPAA